MKSDIVVVVTCANVSIFLSVERTSTRRTGQFVIKSRSRLTNHVRYTVETATLTQCTNTCLADDSCLSINYHYRSQTVQKSCEINSDTHNNNPDDLVQHNNYQYVAFKVE